MNISGFVVLCVLFYPYTVLSNFVTTEQPQSTEVLEGGTVIFHCHTSLQDRENYDIAWFSESRNAFLSKNAVLSHRLDVDTRTRYSITRSHGHKFDLRIDEVKAEDAGRFLCMYASQDTDLLKEYYNNVGPAAELVVWTPPTDSSPACLIDDTLSNGDVDFVCVSEGGNPMPSLQLYADDVRLQPTPVSADRMVYVKIKLTEAYRGVDLKCELTSKALQSPKTCSLIPLPPIVLITPARGRVMENGDIQFNCSSRGLDNPTYEWMAAPNLIPRRSFPSELELGIFTIHGAHLADNGSKIICIATGINGDKVVSEATLIVEGVRPRATESMITIEPTDLIMPLKPRAKPNAGIDFFQNNALILAICVAGLFIVLLSMVALVIVCKRKRKSYEVNAKVDVLVDTTYEKFDQKKILNANLFSEMDKMNDQTTTQESVNGSPLGSPATSPTRSQPSPKQSPKLTSKHFPCQSLDQSPSTSPTLPSSASTSQQSTPLYAKPMKGGVNQAKSTAHHPSPAYAMPMKHAYVFHLSLEDITGKSPSKDSPGFSIGDTCLSRINHGHEYAVLTNVLPTKDKVNGNKYEEIPLINVDPRKLNVEGLNYADLEINKQCTSEVRSDSSMKTQYAEIASPDDAIE